MFDAGPGTVRTETKCQLPDAVGTITYTGTGAKSVVTSSYTEQATINVRLRYDEETGHYVDVGSSYSYSTNGSYTIVAGKCTHEGSRSGQGAGMIADREGTIDGSTSWDDSIFHLGVGMPYSWTGQGVMRCESGVVLPSSDSGTDTFTPHCRRDDGGDQVIGFYKSGSNPMVYEFSCTHASGDSLNWVDTISGTIIRYR